MPVLDNIYEDFYVCDSSTHATDPWNLKILETEYYIACSWSVFQYRCKMQMIYRIAHSMLVYQRH